MPFIEEFPTDESFWVIKWVDKFTLPHLATRSAAVSVLLQRLNLKSVSELNRLSKDAATSLLRLNPKALNSGSDAERFIIRHVLAGSLPHLRIGRVYHRQRLIGELPTSQAQIELSAAEQSCREVKIGDRLQAPTGWKYPYPLIRAAEFDGIQNPFSRSRCLVFTDSKSAIEYIIPRTVIFQRLYAPTTELANAFTSGPWAMTKSSIVHEKELFSGLKTKIDADTGDWHIVLEPHVDKELAPLVALYYFDSHAHACAASIYTYMLSARQRGPDYAWYASTPIPFRVESKPLRLGVNGFQLPPRVGQVGEDGERVVHKRSFLVTSISQCSWPEYPPTIWWEKFNSGEKGEQQIPADDDKPYFGFPESMPAGSELKVLSNVDASANMGGMIVLEDTLSWFNPPRVEKLAKKLSKMYSAGGSTPWPPEPSLTASGGRRSHEGGNAAPADHKLLVRDPVNSFIYLLKAFDELVQSRDLVGYSILQPIDPSQKMDCGSQPCWNFLGEVARRTGRWPSSGWRMLERARGRGADRSFGQPRSALIVRVQLRDNIGYWIEVESRGKSSGSLSPFLVDLGSNEQVALQHTMELIARAEGRKLNGVTTDALKELGYGVSACYKHHYRSDQNSELDPDSLRRFMAQFKS